MPSSWVSQVHLVAEPAMPITRAPRIFPIYTWYYMFRQSGLLEREGEQDGGRDENKGRKVPT